MLCTHRDEDHLGGLDEVIESGYDVREAVWDNGSTKVDPPNRSDIADFVQAANSTTAGPLQRMPLGHVVQLGQGATATCVAVGGEVLGVGQVVPTPSENDQSVAILVRYGDFEYITAGDLGGGSWTADGNCTKRSTDQANIESPLAKALMPGGATAMLTVHGVEVLDVNHHGSESSTNHEWMNLLSPTLAVINTGPGQGTSYHHPREDVVEKVLLATVFCITVPPALVLQTEEGFPAGTNTSFDAFCVGDIVIETSGSGSFEVSATGLRGSGPDERLAAELPRVFPLDGATIAQGLVITEIMRDPAAVPDNAGEWFELYNPGPVAIDINGWRIRDDGSDLHIIAAGGPLLVPARGRVVLGRNGDPAQNGGFHADYVYRNFSFANGADEIVIEDATGRVVDRVAYTAGSGWPGGAGQSMQLREAGLDNALGSSWAASVARGGSFTGGGSDLGSPGS